MPDRRPSDEELFMSEVEDVRPLERRDRVPVRTPAAPRPVPDPDEEVRRALDDLVSGQAPLDVSDTDEFLEGAAKDADRRTVRRLRRGALSWQAHLDLHGLTAEEARPRIAKFVIESRHAGKRVVLLVHGRGLNSPDGVPVLKEKLKAWLGRSGLSRHVLAFCTARPHDGGAGALYVLLRA